MNETFDLSLIKERKRNAIISHQKYANPHSRSYPSIGTVVIHSKTASADKGTETKKKPFKPVMIKKDVINKITKFVVEKSTI